MIPTAVAALSGRPGSCRYPGRVHPNVLLVVFDTARADTFEPYGAPRGAGPVVGELAARGIALPSVYATSNWTLPSHASMFTGLLPRTLGLGGSVPPKSVLARHAPRTLASVLSKAGYATGAVSANLWVSPRNGFAEGFERFVEVGGKRRHRPSQGAAGRGRWAWESVRARIDDGLTEARSVLVDWLDQGPRPPFFWFVNLMECHSPYLPPKPYNDLPLLERWRAGEDARRYQSHEGFLHVCLRDLDVPEASLERMRHLYRRSVRAMDDWLERILELLDERALLDETVVIVTSDHGENLGEGHLLGHALSLDDRLLRVPLVLAGPGSDRVSASSPMSLASLPMVIAAATELQSHPWRVDDLPADAVVAQNDGFGTISEESVRGLMRAWGLSAAAATRLFTRDSCAYDGRFKLVDMAGEERLYDLATDPLEERDVLANRPDVAARLRAIITGANEPVAGRPIPADSGPGSAEELVEEDAALAERMRLLGYL